MAKALPAALERVARRRRFGVRPGLEGMRRLLRALGEPQERFTGVHLAGTNGKGSTAAMAAAALGAAGHRVGLYTSPHLCRFNERIVVDGHEIDDATLERLADEALRASPDATFFELATAIAFSHFAACEVDLAVVETGLGGRWDATNLFEPLVSVITPIAYDHVGVLGETLTAIAGEKAGIIKAGTAAISARQEPEVLTVLEERAVEFGAYLSLEERDFHWQSRVGGMDFQGPGQCFEGLRSGLRGRHQEQNGALTLAALGVLNERGWAVPAEAARKGLEEPRWPGRLEEIGGFLLDCAHNVAAATALAEVLAAEPHPRTLIFGALADKAAGEMLAALAPHVEGVVLCAPSGPRGGDPTSLAHHWPRARIVADLPAALNAVQGKKRVVITGSCHLVGEARAHLLGQEHDGLGDPVAAIR